LDFATEPAEHKGVIGADQNCETENEDMSKDVDYEEIYLSARPTTSKPTRKQMRKNCQNWRKSVTDMGPLTELARQLQLLFWKILEL